MGAIATLKTKSRHFRDKEVIIVNIAATAPAANSTYDVVLPAGHYYLALAVKEAVTGTTTDATIARLIVPQAGGTSVLAGVNLNFYQATGAILTTLAIDTLTQDIVQITPNADFAASPHPVAISSGLRVTLVKGTAVAGEVMELTLIATRVG